MSFTVVFAGFSGYANVLRFGGVRIGGISGIYKERDYMKGHFEHPPYNDDTKRSAYHVRNLEVFRMKQVSGGKKSLEPDHKAISLLLQHWFL